MVVLGLDPGLASTGWGVVVKDGARLKLVAFGVLKTAFDQPLPRRLLDLKQGLVALVKKFKPQTVAVEKLFFYKNVKTALLVSQARGVLLLAVAELKLPVVEFTPLEVKQAITSYGRADKMQVQKMVKVLLGLPAIPKPDDAADALAVAITCLQVVKFKTTRSW